MMMDGGLFCGVDKGRWVRGLRAVQRFHGVEEGWETRWEYLIWKLAQRRGTWRTGMLENLDSGWFAA